MYACACERVCVCVSYIPYAVINCIMSTHLALRSSVVDNAQDSESGGFRFDLDQDVLRQALFL